MTPVQALALARAYTKKVLTWAGGGLPDWGIITNKPSAFPPSPHNHTTNQITDLTNTDLSQFRNQSSDPFARVSDLVNGGGHSADTNLLINGGPWVNFYSYVDFWREQTRWTNCNWFITPMWGLPNVVPKYNFLSHSKCLSLENFGVSPQSTLGTKFKQLLPVQWMEGNTEYTVTVLFDRLPVGEWTLEALVGPNHAAYPSELRNLKDWVGPPATQPDPVPSEQDLGVWNLYHKMYETQIPLNSKRATLTFKTPWTAEFHGELWLRNKGQATGIFFDPSLSYPTISVDDGVGGTTEVPDWANVTFGNTADIKCIWIEKGAKSTVDFLPDGVTVNKPFQRNRDETIKMHLQNFSNRHSPF